MQAREAICDALRNALSDGAHCDGSADLSGDDHRCFVGLSGGLDSTVLLHALVHHVVRDAGARGSSARPGSSAVVALHADHALHEQAERWSRHCQALCTAWGVTLNTQKLVIRETGGGLEAAARDARYAWFETQLGPGDRLLLAHHQDDQAETLLLRLLRGAGPDGLAAIPEQRTLGTGSLLRPLLSLPREVLLDYAREHGLQWLTDPSNADLRFDRNYLRSEILPRLEERWPGYRKTFARAARLMRNAASLQAQDTLPLCFSVVGDPGFSIAALPKDLFLAARAVRRWLRDRGLAMPSSARLEEFLRQLTRGRGAQLATAQWTLQRFRQAVYVYATSRDVLPGARVLKPGESLHVPGVGTIELSARPDVFAGASLMLTFRQGGERFSDQEGLHRSLKAVFQRYAVPPWWRDRMPLLSQSRADSGELLAVGSFARSPAAVAAGVELDWQPAVLVVK